MKSWLLVPLLVVLQVALSPLCLCHGMAGGGDSNLRPASCCHDEGPASEDHCPHCEGGENFHLTSPAKVMVAPDGGSVELPDRLAAGPLSPLGAESDRRPVGFAELQDPIPWPHSERASLAVFLI